MLPLRLISPGRRLWGLTGVKGSCLNVCSIFVDSDGLFLFAVAALLSRFHCARGLDDLGEGADSSSDSESSSSGALGSLSSLGLWAFLACFVRVVFLQKLEWLCLAS